MTLLLAVSCCTILGAAEKRFNVVLGSFATHVAAEKARNLNSTGTELTILQARLSSGDVAWRLVSGPFENYEDALREKEQLSQQGVEAPWITSEQVVQFKPQKTTQESPVKASAATVAVPVFKDLLGNPTLLKRGIPTDLTKGILPRMTGQASNKYRSVAGQSAAPGVHRALLPAMNTPESNRVSQLQQIEITDIRFRGSNLLAAELETLVTPYRGRTVSTEQLLDLKNQANRLFVVNGYINSGVLIPDQQVEDGIVYLDVIEGKVSSIKVSGDLREAYVRNRLNVRSPFNLKDLQMSLKLLEKNPLVERVHARVIPGSRIGTANVDISVDSAKRFRLGILSANNRSPGIGAEYGELYLVADNLTSLGDSLHLSAAITEGMDSYGIGYGIPFNARDHRLIFDYSRSDSTAIEEPFDAINIRSLTESVKIGVILPLSRTPNSEFAIEVHLEKRRNFTSLLGKSFSFSAGAINGESRVAPIRLGASYVHQGLHQSFAGRMVLSRGTTAFDSTEQPAGADGEFTSVMAQLQYSRQLGTNFHITGRFLAQYAADPLLAIERVSIGGLDTVRGYRENFIVRDNVYLASLEGRYRLPIDSIQFQLVSFFDWGSGKNHKDAVSSKRDTIYSVGAGFSIRALRYLSADLYFAHGFQDVNVQHRDLQDDGIHFKLSYEYRF